MSNPVYSHLMYGRVYHDHHDAYVSLSRYVASYFNVNRPMLHLYQGGRQSAEGFVDGPRRVAVIVPTCT